MLEQLATPFIGAGVGGLVTRLLLSLFSGWNKRKNDRSQAEASKLSDGKLTWNNDLDEDTKHTANHIVLVMCYLFTGITVLFAFYPEAQLTTYLPETVQTTELDLFFFTKTWNSDLEKSVLTISSGGVVYQSMMFATYIISALYKGK